MGRRTRLVWKRVARASLVHAVLFWGAGGGSWGSLSVSLHSHHVPVRRRSAGAPRGWKGRVLPKERGQSINFFFFFFIFFLFDKFVILTETNVRGKKYSSEKAEALPSVILTSHWKREPLVNKQKKISKFPQKY